ncbi:hypothetical protein F0358_00255 [Empedobacter brevis]|uniref:hypothetical protein n=1 Tax=Empedobacter brevis TaxID=247 RepID=UPI00123CCF02|nr:hypothetical protein [Empedobacter brevis]QES91257.1 hypothetical protein F0358_00255 [Empedobacter brevis]
MKAICIILLILILSIFIINCSNKEVYSQNLELKIKVINNLKNEPIANAKISVYKIEKSVFGKYFWKQYKVFEKKNDEKGYLDINIDSKSTYKIKVTIENQNIWSCSSEFEAQDIDLKKVYEIRCLDESEKENIK